MHKFILLVQQQKNTAGYADERISFPGVRVDWTHRSMSESDDDLPLQQHAAKRIRRTIADAPDVRSSMTSTHLFSDDWKPGFLVQGGKLIAVKARRVSVDFKDAIANAPRQTNLLVNSNTLYAFRDGKEETNQAFATAVLEKRSVRVAVWYGLACSV